MPPHQITIVFQNCKFSESLFRAGGGFAYKRGAGVARATHSVRSSSVRRHHPPIQQAAGWLPRHSIPPPIGRLCRFCFVRRPLARFFTPTPPSTSMDQKRQQPGTSAAGGDARRQPAASNQQPPQEEDQIEHTARSIQRTTVLLTTFRQQAPEPIVIAPGHKIGDWTIKRQLGAGVFGAVFLCRRPNDTCNSAMKIERVNNVVSLLGLEVLVYEALAMAKDQFKRPHFPLMIGRGKTPDGLYSYLVMTLVGDSLQDLRKNRPDKKFTMGTSLNIGLQTLSSLVQLHAVGYLHRDIKPANFAIGSQGSDRSWIYMLDFGMARKFVNESGQLRRPRQGKIGFRGTLKYASVSAHLHRELCRADDVESWFYQLVEFIKGRLPWSHLTDPVQIYTMKKNIRSGEGMDRKRFLGGTPRQFAEMLEMVKGLKYYDTPPYQKLKELIKDAIKTTNVKTRPLDWERPTEKTKSTANLAENPDEKAKFAKKAEKNPDAKSDDKKKQTKNPDAKSDDKKKQSKNPDAEKKK